MAFPPDTTAVPFPVLGNRGYVQPDTSQVLTGVQSDINGAFGNNLNFSTQNNSPTNSTPQGQLAASLAAITSNTFGLIGLFTNLVDPAYSSGRMQDAIARIYFITRFSGQPTVQPCLCFGLEGRNIPVGSIAQDQNKNFWVAIQEGTISGGSVLLDFACATNGPTPAPSSLTIYQALFGWESISPSGAAVLGRNEETAPQFERRRSASTGLNSMGPLNALYAAVASVAGVIDVFPAQNNTSSPAVIGGVTIPANAIFVSVLGGDPNAVALAIFSRKMPGGPMAGNTVVVVTDPNPAFVTPAPTYQITFNRPTVTDFAVVVTITNSSQVPSNALQLVQQAIINAFAGLDGGPPATIGSEVYALRYYTPVANIGNTFNNATGQVIPGWSAAIVSIQIGIDGAAASITGSLSGGHLTVTSLTSGSISVGDLVEGTGVITNGTPLLITSQLSGSVGGTGVYVVNGTLSAVSQTMSLSAMGNTVQTTINQAPAVAAGNVYLALQ